jgi:hypothetical protein
MARATMSRGASSRGVVGRHEARAVRQAQQAALAAQGLGDQEGLGVRVVQAGRVELDELHVRHPAAGAPGHGDAVAGGRVGVGGVEIDLAGAAGGERRVAGAQGQHAVAGDVEHVGAEAAVARQAQLGGRDQVDRDVAFEHRDVGVLPDLLGQGCLHGATGGIGGMDDAALAVAAFARQVKAQRRAVMGKRNATFDQPLDGFAAMLDDKTGGGRVAQAGAGVEGIADVGVDAVGRVEYRGDAALRPG